jgi:hypothetical protein
MAQRMILKVDTGFDLPVEILAAREERSEAPKSCDIDNGHLTPATPLMR